MDNCYHPAHKENDLSDPIQRDEKVCWVTPNVSIGIQPTAQPNRITLNIAPNTRVIVPEVIVTIARFGVGILARKTQWLSQRASGLSHFAERRLLSLPDDRLALIGNHLGSTQMVGDDIVGLGVG